MEDTGGKIINKYKHIILMSGPDDAADGNSHLLVLVPLWTGSVVWSQQLIG